MASPSLRLDSDSGILWLGTQEIRLRPKAFAVLHTLVKQAGRIVSREEIVRVVWSHTKVSEVVLRGCLREIRQALGDSTQSPRFIETIPRRGWRFLSPLTPASRRSVAKQPLRTHRIYPTHQLSQLPTLLIDREKELVHLWQHLEQAQHGKRQIVFVTGEVGIGKTALLDAFLMRAAATANVWTARGQCVEQYGAGEPYLPVLEALGRLCQDSEAKQVIPPPAPARTDVAPAIT